MLFYVSYNTTNKQIPEMKQPTSKTTNKISKGYPILLSPRGDTPPKKITSPIIDLTVYSGSHIPMKRGTIERFIKFEKIK